MMRPRLAAVTLAGLFVACVSGRDDVRVGVAMDLTMPRAVLDRVTKISLQVLEGSVTCDPATGTIAYPDGVTAAKELQKRDLNSQGCPQNVRWCGDVAVDKSDTPRVFAATGRDDADAVLAVGCASAKISDDQVTLPITMFRYLAPAVCNDGTIEPTEQCEPGGTATCDDKCHSKEILLSTGSSQNGTVTGDPGTKLDPFFLWPPLSGNPGRFFAFFTDKAVNNNADVGLRVMTDALEPVTTPPALAAGEIFLPNGGVFPPTQDPRQQSAPQAAFLDNRYYVVFQDDNSPTSNGLDIHLRSFDDALQSSGADATTINGSGASPTGEPNIQQAPAIAAGTKDRLYVTWEDASGKIVGRTLTPPSTLGNQNDVSTGTGNAKVSLAATGSGWVAVWQSATGVKLRAINEDGTPQGAEQIVSEGGDQVDRPRVASLADGRFAVAWSAGGDVFVQRYDAKGGKIPGDQSSPVNDVVKDGTQSEAAIAGSTAADGSYVVAWLDEASGHVRARNLGGSAGFLFNNVNGQSTEYQASAEDGRSRATPVVASGGSGPFVAIGWVDTTKQVNVAGIVVRRFPAPSP